MVSFPISLDPPEVPKSPVLLGQAAFGPSLEEGKYRLKITKGKNSYETEFEFSEQLDSEKIDIFDGILKEWKCSKNSEGKLSVSDKLHKLVYMFSFFVLFSLPSPWCYASFFSL